MIIGKILFLSITLFAALGINAQELLVKVNINHSQIEGSDNSVFNNLQQSLEQFLNERQWTSLQFQKNERLHCTFNITVNKYVREESLFECSAIIQANRPVFNSTYTSTLFNIKDENFNFKFSEFDQVNYNDETVDNQLTALLAYYSYLIIGMNLDSFALMGGTEVLQQCFNLVNSAQNLGYPGWKPYEDSRNRFAIINDLLSEAMKPFRKMHYDYYRLGLDEMAGNVDRGRTQVTDALENGLKVAHNANPLSLLPQIWTDYKKEELMNIYHGHGNSKEKESVYNLLMSINASQSTAWEKIVN
ncbi:MAG: DUF4835 family protein [Prevotella sp.]|nr:DUF4835 family protein [Prevotella sp.]